MHTDTKSRPHTCNVPVSKVWLQIVTTVSLLRVCPGIQTLVFSIVLVYSEQHTFIPFHRSKTSSSLFCSITEPCSSLWSIFSSFTSHCFFFCFFLQWKEKWLIYSVSAFPFLSSSITEPAVTFCKEICLDATASCFMSQGVSIILFFVFLPAFVLLHLRHTIIYFLSQSWSQTGASNHGVVCPMYLNVPFNEHG